MEWDIFRDDYPLQSFQNTIFIIKIYEEMCTSEGFKGHNVNWTGVSNVKLTLNDTWRELFH